MNALVRKMQVPTPPKELVLVMTLAEANLLLDATSDSPDSRFVALMLCLRYAFREDHEKDGLA